MTKKIKNYFLGRADEVTAWLGVIGFMLEILLHASPSYIMLGLFTVLFILPDAHFSNMFKGWAVQLRAMND